MSDRFRLLPEGIISAILCSRSFAINKPSIGRVEKEHILGLANLLERTALQLQAALTQQAAAIPPEMDVDAVPGMRADYYPEEAWCEGWNACRDAMLAAAPAAPVAQEPVALEQRATEAYALLRRVYDSGFDDDCVDAVGDWLNEHHTSPAAEQPDTVAVPREVLRVLTDTAITEWHDPGENEAAQDRNECLCCGVEDGHNEDCSVAIALRFLAGGAE